MGLQYILTVTFFATYLCTFCLFHIYSKKMRRPQHLVFVSNEGLFQTLLNNLQGLQLGFMSRTVKVLQD